jgi:putative MATE family efflux protein
MIRYELIEVSMTTNKHLWAMTWPILIEMIFLTLYGTVDTLMLSKYSDTAVGSVGVANTLLMLFAIVLNIIALGIGAIASQYVGAKHIQKAKDVIKNGMVANTIIGIVLSIVLMVFGRLFLTWMGVHPSMMEDAQKYLFWVSISLIFLATRSALSSGFRVFGENGIIMKIMMIGNVLNIVLNFILIYGFWFIPELGAEGAAIGTMLSRLVILILFIIPSYKVLHMRLHVWVWDLEVLTRMSRVGFPAALENIMWNIAQVMIISMINGMVLEAIIARTYIQTILSYIFTYSFALASANAVIIGYYIGENDKEGGFKHTFKTLKTALIGVWLLALIVNLSSPYLMRLFTSNEVIIEMGQKTLWLAFGIETGRTMNLVFISALRTAGETIFPLIMGTTSMFLVAVLGSYLFGVSLGLGIFGVFIATMLDELTRGTSNMLKFMKKSWMNLEIIERSNS